MRILLLLLVSASCLWGQIYLPVRRTSWVDYKSALLAETNLTHLWLFDDANGQITDHKATNHLAIPSGMTMGQGGLLVNDARTAANANGANALVLTDTNTFNYTSADSYTFEYIFASTNARSGTAAQYFLASKLKTSGPFDGWCWLLNYNPNLGAIPSTWMTIQFLIGDTASHQYTAYAKCNIPNSVITHLVLSYSVISNEPAARVWLNGNEIAMFWTTAPAITAEKNTRTCQLLNFAAGASGFLGRVQCIASFTNTLSEEQILTHYEAAQGRSYQPNSYLYSSFKGLDSDGDLLRLSNPSFLYVNGLYYAYGQGTTGVDKQVCVAGYWDQTNVNKVTVYTNATMGARGWGKAGTGGIALDMSSYSLFELVRAQVIYNASTDKYVMWGRLILGANCDTGNQVVMVAESSTPAGPFTVLSTNGLLAGTTAADFAIFKDDNGTAYAVWAASICPMDANYHATTGAAATTQLPTAGFQEGFAAFRRGTNIFIIGSSSQYYQNLGMADVKYITANAWNGTWTAPVSVYATNPLGSGLETQATGGPFRFAADTNRFIYAGDYWYNRRLSRSTVVFSEISFPTTNTLSIAPVKRIALP